MFTDLGLSKFLWKEALKFVMWIQNHITTHQLDGKTPYEAFYGIKLDDLLVTMLKAKAATYTGPTHTQSELNETSSLRTNQ